MSSTANVSLPDQSRVGTKYRTYKRATDILAGWLTTTAKKLKIDHFKINGHALRISQFSSVASHIVEAIPKVEVPLDIVHTAETALHFRQERANLLRGTDVESDQRHQHIITAIEDVVSKLKCHTESSKQSSKSSIVSIESKETARMASSFQFLDVEPLDSGDESDSNGEKCESAATNSRMKINKNKKKKLQKQKKKARKEAKQKEGTSDEEDPYFVLMCLLSDLKGMRTYIKEVWQEYKEGKVDLVTASLTANATFDIIRTYETDFPAISHLLTDHSKIMRLVLSSKLSNEVDDNLDFFFKSSTISAKNEQDRLLAVGKILSVIPQSSDLTFASAFYFLNGPRHSIVQRIKKGEMQVMDEAKNAYGTHQPTQSRQKLNFPQRFLEDNQILADYAKHVYICDDWEHFVLDHFTRQWREDFAKTGNKTITLAQAFGAQLYLDTQNVLRQDSIRGLQDLFHSTEEIEKSRVMWEQYTPQDVYKKREDLRQMKHNIQFTSHAMLSKVYRPIVNQMVKETGSKDTSKANSGSLLRKSTDLLPFMRMNPVMCGILLFSRVQTVRNAARNISSYFETVKFAGQIYYGCRMQRQSWKERAESDANFMESELGKALTAISPLWTMPMVWDDMEFLFQLHGVDSFFEGHIPTTNYELVRIRVPSGQLEVGRTYKTSTSHREGTSHPIVALPKQTRREFNPIKFDKIVNSFEPIALSHRLYFAKYGNFRDRKQNFINDWSLETLTALLQAHLDKIKVNGKGVTSLKGADGDISQVTILRALKETLHRESRALHFDYLAFFTITYHVLDTIKNAAPHLLDMFIIPWKDSNAADNTADAAAMIFTAANAPGSGVGLDPIDGSEEGDIFTNEGHILIDRAVFTWVYGGAQSKQIEKIDDIWGIAPATS